MLCTQYNLTTLTRVISGNTLLLCFLLVFCAFIEHSHAATKVMYEFHIREQPNERSETGSLNNNKDSTRKPEVVITGTRFSQVIHYGKDENSTNSVYKETAYYTADESGYHVKYNCSVIPIIPDVNLHGTTLKVITG